MSLGADEAPQSPLLRGSAVGRRVSRRGASAPAGIPSLSRKEPAADPVRHGTRRVYSPQAHQRRARREPPYATGHAEATALDLVGYVGHAGGLGQVGTVLCELAERLDPEKLAAAARRAPVPWAQRLGYLLEHLGFDAKTPALKAYVREEAKQSTMLLPKGSQKRSRRNSGWKLYVNAKVEAEQ